MNSGILISDPLHIHSRNFSSLFKFIKERKLECHTFSRCGEFRNQEEYNISEIGAFGKYRNILLGKTFKDLLDFVHRSVYVREVVQAELLKIIVSKGLFEYSFSNDSEALKFAYEEFNAEFMSCYALTLFWLDIWYEEVSSNNYRYAVIFSGSSIASKSLLYTCRFFGVEPLVAETFFTGKHFYLENKYEPLPNNSDIKFMEGEFNPDRDFKRWAVTSKHLKFVGVNNKNVRQPSAKESSLPFEEYILLTCQVVNDYSLLDSSRDITSSITIYKDLIDTVLDCTEYNLIIKVHPWERNKTYKKIPATLQILEEYIEAFPSEKRARVYLTEEFNLPYLITGSITMITLCSQSGLEAGFYGKKAITIGGAFYERRGFTHDVKSPKEIIPYLTEEGFRGKLTIDEFNWFISFMNYCFYEHLVGSDTDVYGRLRNVLKSSPKILPKSYVYQSKKSFLIRNLFKIFENPMQIFKDVRVVFYRFQTKVLD